MKPVCLAIIAHAGARDTINDFWALWKELGVDILGFMPAGEQWPGDERPARVFNYGTSAHRGPLAFQRMVHAWKTLGESEYERAVLIEPDCVPMRNELPHIYPSKLGGWKCMCEPWMWPEALLPPWTGSRETFARLAAGTVAHSRRSHEDCLDLTDRWISKAATLAGIQTESIPNVLGYVWYPAVMERIKRERPAWCHGFKRKAEIWKQ